MYLRCEVECRGLEKIYRNRPGTYSPELHAKQVMGAYDDAEWFATRRVLEFIW